MEYKVDHVIDVGIKGWTRNQKCWS